MHYFTKSTVRFIKKKNQNKQQNKPPKFPNTYVFKESLKNPPFIASPLWNQFAVKGHELKYTVYAKSRKRGK